MFVCKAPTQKPQNEKPNQKLTRPKEHAKDSVHNQKNKDAFEISKESHDRYSKRETNAYTRDKQHSRRSRIKQTFRRKKKQKMKAHILNSIFRSSFYSDAKLKPEKTVVAESGQDASIEHGGTSNQLMVCPSEPHKLIIGVMP